MLVFDTDMLSIVLRGSGAGADYVRKRLSTYRIGQIVTTVITYEEQMRGWMSFAAKAATVKQLVDAYGKLQSNLDDFREIEVLPFTESAAIKFQDLRKRPVRIGTMDLRIASIVLTYGATLVTRNTRDFVKVPGLDMVDWTASPP